MLDFLFKKPKPQPRVLDGDQFTTKWWCQKTGYKTKHEMISKISKLERKGILERVNIGEFEITKFVPEESYSVNDIVEMMKKGLDK